MARKLNLPLADDRAEEVAAFVRQMMPAHKVYCEPWFYGGEVFFRKAASQVEVLNDPDNRLVAFYLTARNHPQELSFLMECTLCSEAMLAVGQDIYKGKVPADDVYKAWSVWLRHRSHRFNAAVWLNEALSKTHADEEGFTAVRSILDDGIAHRLEKTLLVCRAASDVIRQTDSEETLFVMQPRDNEAMAEALRLIPSLKGKAILLCPDKKRITAAVLKTGLRAEKDTKGNVVYVNFRYTPSLFE